jgi:hypothetical protein
MTAWVEEGPDKVLPKRKNLRSLFRDDDCAYGLTTLSDLKESLISDEAREDARSQSRLESENNKLQPGVLVQALQSWTCSSQSSLTVVIPEEKSRHENNQDYSNVEFSTLVVREGDCLSEISRLVRVPIHVLQRVNSIANIESLKPGQALLIPRIAANQTKRKQLCEYLLLSLLDYCLAASLFLWMLPNLILSCMHAIRGSVNLYPDPKVGCMMISKKCKVPRM